MRAQIFAVSSPHVGIIKKLESHRTVCFSPKMTGGIPLDDFLRGEMCYTARVEAADKFHA